MLKTTIALSFIILFFYGVGCSDDSTGHGGEDVDVDVAQGTISVTGAIEAEHKGVSYYIPLKSQSGGFNNLNIRISDTNPQDGNEEPIFSLSFLMIGQEGPFELTEGQYELGPNPESAGMTATYVNNMESGGRVSYGASSESSGTLTILSYSNSQIVGSFSLQLEAGLETDSGFVTVSGEFNAECIGGFSC